MHSLPTAAGNFVDHGGTHPITRLARTRIEAGIAMPSAAAAFLFTTSSYSVALSTGSSPALAPFSTRASWSAARPSSRVKLTP